MDDHPTDTTEDTKASVRRAALARAGSPYLTTKQAAFHLGLAEITLRRLRASGKGPKCRMHTRAFRYHIDDLETWSAEHAKGGEHA